jgi:hypothetical protein
MKGRPYRAEGDDKVRNGERQFDIPGDIGLGCNELSPEPRLIEIHGQRRFIHGDRVPNKGGDFEDVILTGGHAASISVAPASKHRHAVDTPRLVRGLGDSLDSPFESGTIAIGR